MVVSDGVHGCCCGSVVVVVVLLVVVRTVEEVTIVHRRICNFKSMIYLLVCIDIMGGGPK